MQGVKMYPLAPNGIFHTLQGEGHLLGQPMTFIRLAGCSVGCPECDTDYSVDTRASADKIALDADALTPPSITDRWAWITGGEPTDHDLGPLVTRLKAQGFAVGLATSGVRRVIVPVDWLSVSPHSDRPLAQTYGHEIKLVPWLNGLDAEAWIERYDRSIDFWLRFLQPLDKDDNFILLRQEQCLAIQRKHPRWGLTTQMHKTWCLP